MRSLPLPRAARRLACALAAAAVLAGCAYSTSAITGRPRAYAYAWTEELALGREADRQIVRQYGTYDEDPALTAYVERVGEAVLAQSHFRRPGASPELAATRFTFRVLDSDVVNAFALPGGYVYVTRGLLAHVDSEAQLAVVLGHEIGHVAARHASQRQLDATLSTLGLLGASLLGEELAGIGDEILQLGGTGMQLFLLRYSRDHERESDELGVEYAARAGYAAGEGAGFFTVLRRMGAKEGGGLPGFLSTHPDPGRREEAIARMTQAWAAQGVAGTRVAREEHLARIDGMVLGSDPRWGYVENGAVLHPRGRFRFAVPAGWTAERREREVVMTPSGETSLGVLVAFDAGTATAAEAASRFVAEGGITPARQYPTTRDGMRAYVVEAAGQDATGPWRATTTFVERAGGVLSLQAMAPQARAAEADGAAATALRTLRPLSDAQAGARAPVRLRVTATTREATFRALLPARLPAGMDATDLAILNHRALDERIPRGTRLKLPR